ncbi:MAG: TRAP transporter permease [Bacillota bacterium]
MTKQEKPYLFVRIDHALETICRIFAFLLPIYLLYSTFFGNFEAVVHRAAVLMPCMVIIYLELARKLETNIWSRILTLILGLLSIFSIYHFMQDREAIAMRGGMPTMADIFWGTVLILLVLETTRRRMGWPLPTIALAFIVYAFIGPYLPWPFTHSGFSYGRVVSQITLLTEGIWGVALGTIVNEVIFFLILGAFMRGSGVGDYFTDVAFSIFGQVRGGPAKVAVVGSSLMGMVTGVATANVAAIGQFTIPLMKRVGYRSEVAAAIEAVSSAGAQLVPPVMGAAAFLIADTLGISYLKVSISVILPVIIYYITLFMVVDLEAAKGRLPLASATEVASGPRVLVNRGYLLLPIAFVIISMALLNWSPGKSALWATGLTILVSWFSPSSRMGFKKIIEALIESTYSSIDVVLATACAGVVIAIINRTGLGASMSGIIVSLGGESLIMVLFLSMVAATILGMGLPTIAVYVLMSALVIPALIQMNVAPIAAHLFIFFYASMSAITPPVALGAYAAAAIAQADPLRASWNAFKIGLAGFIVPWAFVFGPELLFEGSTTGILITALSSSIGAVALAVALQGYLMRPLALWERVIAAVSSVLLISVGWFTDIIGYTLFGMLIIYLRLTLRQNRQLTTVNACKKVAIENIIKKEDE